MRHGLHLSKLSRTTSHRVLMLRNLVSSLLQHEQISTTLPKAKAAQKLADQVIGWGKQGGRDNWNRANAFLLNGKDTLTPLFTTFAERYAARPGGYTRILRSGYRQGDNAPLAVLELVDNKNDLRFENAAKTVGRELAIRTRDLSLGPEAFQQFRTSIEANGDEGIVEALSNSTQLGSITRKNIVKALQFRSNPLVKLPVSRQSTTEPLESISSNETVESGSDALEPVKSVHPANLFLNRVYHHYLSNLAHFSLSDQNPLGPDPERPVSQLTQKLYPSESKPVPKPVLTVPTVGKKFLAGEQRQGYEIGQQSNSTTTTTRGGMGPISRAKGDWSKNLLDRQRRVRHATREMDQLEQAFAERL
ncbi:mitochondrial 54S ribosomal protein bL17m MRPL8 [Sporobolomyces koalae]|uniref:mitochondrial 54S ribosomal protein bL17m MRPL8 n=1 Tax=Sporobolomyces koalae TaxID=500713 RepID=UPI00317594DF